MRSVAVLIISVVLLLSGCAGPAKDGPALTPVAPRNHPRFADDLPLGGLREAVLRSLDYLERVPADRPFSFGEDVYPAAHLSRSLTRFLGFLTTDPDSKALSRFIREHYRIYRSSGHPETGKVLFTGYYEPLLTGSRTPTPVFQYPVYGRPEDLAVVDLSRFSQKYDGEKITGRVSGKTFVPYFDREAIEETGALRSRAEPLAWVDDRIDLFFLQIQGSGKIALTDGEILNVGYTAQNGRPYRSIGRLLIDEGKIPKSEMSMQRLKAYLRAHPEEVDRILYHNPSYVFFSLKPDGPRGALNVPLTPGRSLAVDRKVFPMPALAFVQAEKPVVDDAGEIRKWIDFGRFVLTQDTGGAITGPGRADLFWGHGPYAELAAGHMNHRGELFFLVLKPQS
jgi:membrane-bound lytic murein transglycosylase A